MNTTHDLHNDQRETLVEVKGKLFRLVEIPLQLSEVKAMEHKDQPHIRFLNAIPLRTSDEQTSHNSFQAEVQHFARQVPGFGKKKKRITSVRAALREGVAPSAEVEKLLLEKVEAKKKGDKKALRNIRKTLRKLGYKRYKEEHEVEKQTT